MTHENKHRPQKETLFLKIKQESFNSLILDEMGNNLLQNSLNKNKQRKKSSSRTADLILNKQDILNHVEFIDSTAPFPMPKVHKVNPFELPNIAIPFSKALYKSNKDLVVVFYEPDINFARILHNPKRYVEPLKRFACVVGPDFSQKIGMNKFVNFHNHWWNMALTAFYQSQGVRMIPNITWSDPASYSYSFVGIPKHSVIAINCIGIKGNHAAKYLWRKGYEEAIKVLEPVLIIRYGDKMPGEREDISVYFENINLKNLRNGRKRIS